MHNLDRYLPESKGSGFLERPPLIRAVPPSYRKFMLYEEVSYDVGCSCSNDRITVPEGFITDFASVPRILWPLFPPMGPWSGAAIVHDYLYGSQRRCRSECDDIFLEAMGVLGVRRITRYAMYAGVRIGGMFAWSNKKRI